MTVNLRNPILATIIYYDIFNYPLTLVEVYKFLINPGRIVRLEGGIGEIDLGDIFNELDRLIKSRIIGEKNGFYFIGNREELYQLRIEKYKIADEKWKKFLRLAKFLALAPYLRGVFASGSLAVSNTEKSSDFDVLIIAESGRLYTCRLFLWLISSVLGARRKKHQKIAPNKLCFNHYITDDNLRLTHESLFNAQTYINLKPAMIEPEMIDKFYASNLWLNSYAYNFKAQKDFTGRSVKPPIVFKIFAGVSEVILVSYLGDWLEKALRFLQQKRIKNDPVTYESGGRIVFTDKELEFHPHSFEGIVIEKYKRGLDKAGIVSYIKEMNSGLSGM